VKEQDARRLGELVAEAQADPDVLAVIQFGSTARGEEGRDVDACIVLSRSFKGRPFDKMLHYAGYMSGRRHAGVDVSVFDELPLYIRSRVVRDAVILHVKDERDLFGRVLATIREWDEFRPHYQLYLEAIARGRA
jgi:predicted nucleotidyltransferase